MKNNFYKHLVVLMLVIVSCSKDDTSESGFAKGVPIAEGENFYMTLKTAKSIGEKIYVSIYVEKNEEEYLKGVWIDANANGKRDIDEGVSKEGPLAIVLGSQVIRIYGKITDFSIKRYGNWNKLKNNELTNLDVTTNPALESLRCNGNQLKSLDVSKCKGLRSLSCSNNQLTDLDVRVNSALEYLNCNYNQLKSLDVSKCKELTNLYFDNNQLTDLDVRSNLALGSLSCKGNQLTRLDIANCRDLWDLSCGYNQLTSLDITPFDKLKILSCSLSCVKATEKQIYNANRKRLEVYFQINDKSRREDIGILKTSCE
ncbi:MAG: leucine-rich repeat domain-containing protein [Flavobacteriaceae bacterium]|nr:leucine-rich repeat domain-containing protein [Flavobacteriaceae bacterium]